MRTLLCFLLILGYAARADVRMPKIFTDNMVLQQELPLAIFGWAEPGERVTVSLKDQTQSAQADPNGRWRVTLAPQKADGTALTLKVQGKNTLEFKNVLLGEVWLSSGQSNMSRGLRYNRKKIMAEPMNYPQLRLFAVNGNNGPPKPQREDIAAAKGWAAATHENMTTIFVHPDRSIGTYEYSEVTYRFGKHLHEGLKIPVGMIVTAYPGSQAKEWFPVSDPEKRFQFDVEKQRGEGAIYQSLMHGIAPFTVRGAIWYQGENDGHNLNYDQDLKRLIESWRARFECPDMYFFMTQIGQTTFAGGMTRVWECQAWAEQNVPRTAVAPSNDLLDRGDATILRVDPGLPGPSVGGSNPHPPNKHVIAERLGDIALARVYHVLKREVLAPRYQSHTQKDGRLIVTMNHAGDGLKTDNGAAPNWFEVAAAPASGEPQYVPAQARIIGKDTLEVWADSVPHPAHVRFAWHTLARHNLYNAEGLPALPFRSLSNGKR